MNPSPDAGAPLRVRIRDTFLRPAGLADHALASAPWLDVLLISTAVAVMGVLGMPDEVFFEPMRDAVTRRGQPVEITSSPEEIARWGRILGMLAALTTHPVIAFVIAGVLTLVFSILGGGRGSYVSYLSLSAHTLLIPAAGTLLALLVGLLVGSPVGTNLGAAFSAESDADLWVAVIATIDPFLLWMMVALGVAASRVDGRRGPARTVLLLVAAYLLVVFVSALFLQREVL